MNGYPRFYPRIALVAPSPEEQKAIDFREPTALSEWKKHINGFNPHSPAGLCDCVPTAG